MALDRRIESRVPLEMYLDAYVDDQRQRAFTVNISETGLFVNTLVHEPPPPLTPVALEFTLPGGRDSIWAAGEICYENMDDYFLGHGIRFTGMARLHARMLRDYCFRFRFRRFKALHAS